MGIRTMRDTCSKFTVNTAEQLKFNGQKILENLTVAPGHLNVLCTFK